MDCAPSFNPPYGCRPDFCDTARAEAVARALSRVDWAQNEDRRQPPAMITFLKMLEAAKVEDLPIEKCQRRPADWP